jgi:hypothetical protein
VRGNQPLVQGWYALEDFYLTYKRWADLEQVAEALARNSAGAIQAAFMDALAYTFLWKELK